MKRSEMVKFMSDFMDGGCDPFFGQHASELLTKMEEKGMLPPTRSYAKTIYILDGEQKLDIPKNFTDNTWEPE
jgi:hypothetical protein